MLSATFTNNSLFKKITGFFRGIDSLAGFLLCVGFFCVLLVYLNIEVFDLDIWLHIKTGEQILLNKEIFLNDIYSFTKSGTPWINHEWLFQVISFIVYSFFDFNGIIGMQAVVFIAAFLALGAIGYQKRNFLFLALCFFILLLNSSYRLTVRPDMFSILFLVIYLLIFLKKPGRIYLIPFLQVIWSNIHGFSFIGIAIAFFFAVFGKKKDIWIIFFLSLAASLVNPQFLRGAIYPLATLFDISKDNFVFTFIQELKRPFTSWGDILALGQWTHLKALIIFSAFTFRFNQKKINFSLLALWAISLAASFFAVRNIIYFSFISVASIFYNVNSRLAYDNPINNITPSRKKYFYAAKYIFIAILIFSMHANTQKLIDRFYYDYENYTFKSCFWGTSLRVYPKKAVDFIINERLPDRLFNDFNSGSYIIGRAFPIRKVFIDGRTEFYGNTFLREYKDITSAKKDAITNAIEKYKIEGFFLSMTLSHFDYKLAKFLFEEPRWVTVYFNEDAIIFLEDNQKNKKIIEEHKIDLHEWEAPKLDLIKIGTHILQPYQYLRRARVLQEMGCYKAAISEVEEALRIDPNLVDAYEVMGVSYFKLEEFEEAAKKLRLAVAFATYKNDLRSKYAESLHYIERYEEEEKQWLILKNKTPKNPYVYFRLAQTYKKLNKLNQAQEAIETANKYSRNKNTEYLTWWGALAAELKNLEKAKEIYDTALRLSPGNFEIEEKINQLNKNNL